LARVRWMECYFDETVRSRTDSANVWELS
jgi:hypothetical protein